MSSLLDDFSEYAFNYLECIAEIERERERELFFKLLSLNLIEVSVVSPSSNTCVRANRAGADSSRLSTHMTDSMEREISIALKLMNIQLNYFKMIC
jgi:hypothetical protein